MIVSLTLAQYRMLGRAVRGERLPTANYRSPTAKALHRKRCWVVSDLVDIWIPTPLGKKVYAARGRLRPGHEVYDSATPRERAALGRVNTRYASDEDARLASDLTFRMREAGEMPR